jgi:hypothetical protein
MSAAEDTQATIEVIANEDEIVSIANELPPPSEEYLPLHDDAPFRKSRSTKGVTEAYYFILSLAWNDIVTNGGKLSVKQQEDSIKAKSCQWADILHREFPHVPLKPEVTSSILNIEISMDSGNGMIRKAKEMIHYVNNVLNPVWKDMTSSASFSELEDALLKCRRIAWARNEHDRKKKRKVAAALELTERPFDPSWTFKEWLTFRYLGMPAGDGGCLRIFQATFPGSAAFQSQKKSSSDAKSKDLRSGGRGQSGRFESLGSDASDDDENRGESQSEKKSAKRSQIAMWKQSMYTAEKSRLETLVSLSEKLNMPPEVTQAHLRTLYTYLLTPCTADDVIDEDEREAKSQKISHSSTPPSAVAMSSSSSTSSSSGGEC